jgi:hypothetical protein
MTTWMTSRARPSINPVFSQKTHTASESADNARMQFSLPLSGLIAASVSCGMVVLGVLNRRAGWKRERRETMMDVLLLWAGIRSRLENTNFSLPAASAGARPAATAFSADLFNLGKTLGAGQSVSPATTGSTDMAEPVAVNNSDYIPSQQ